VGHFVHQISDQHHGRKSDQEEIGGKSFHIENVCGKLELRRILDLKNYGFMTVVLHLLLTGDQGDNRGTSLQNHPV
jgi:hypothetical protein